ncbi:MAG: transglutaminase domain-containing protein [Nibricoccus sp.]
MKKLCALAAFLVLLTCSLAAPLPDWINSAANVDLSAWKDEPAVILLEDHTAKYVAADKVVENIRVVLRVGTPHGKKYAMALFGYTPSTERVVDAHAWVLSADRKKIKSCQKRQFREEFLTYSDTEWDDRRVMFYDASAEIETGGLLVWEYQLESCSPITQITHEFSKKLPVVKSRFAVTPLAQSKLQWYATSPELNQPVPNLGMTESVWVLNNIDKEPEDTSKTVDFMRVPQIIYTRCDVGALGAVNFSSWETLSAAAAKIVYSKKAVEPTVKAKALELTQGKSERWERIRALCQFVQKDIRYLAITLDRDYLAGYRPHDAATVLKNRYGDCKDKAMLLAAMLDVIGENAAGLLVNSDNPTEVPKAWPSLSFNHIILAIRASDAVPASWPVIDCGSQGRFVLFDPTDEVSPLGVLCHADRGGFGLLLLEQGGPLVEIPLETPASRGVERVIKAKVKEDGSVDAEFQETFFGSSGSASYAQRLDLRQDGFGKELESRIHRALPEIRAFKWSDNWDAVESRHLIKTEFSALRYGRRLGADRLLIVPSVLPHNLLLDPVKKGFDHYGVRPQCVRETSRIEPPPGWTIAEIPDNWRLEQDNASCRITYKLDQGALVYDVVLLRPGGVFERAAYENLCGFLKKAQEALRRPAILLKKPEEKQPAPAQ